jgi:hypothetical protein
MAYYGPKMLSSSFKNNISTSKKSYLYTYMYIIIYNIAIFIPPLPGRGGGYTVLPRIFLSNYRWQKSDCSMCIKINKVGKQEVGIWWVQKRFPRYGVPIWSLWPNIRFVSSIVAEKNATKNVHILSNYWWQKSDIWSQASYRYPISW